MNTKEDTIKSGKPPFLHVIDGVVYYLDGAGIKHDYRKAVLDMAIELFEDDEEKYMYKSEQVRRRIEALKDSA